MEFNQTTRNFVYDKKVSKWLRLCIKIAMIFLDFYWDILLLIARATRKKHDYKYEVSICAIFYNEGLSLKEWIEYHLTVGVDHFYLFNHESTDNYKEILEPYIKKGIVTMIDWPIPTPALMSAIQHYHKHYKTESRWTAYIDLDEYICPKSTYSIKTWIKKFNNYPSVIMYWKPFGSAGQIDHDYNKLITEQYTVAWDKYYDMGKVFFNNDYDWYDYDKRYLHFIHTKVNIFGLKLALPPINEFKYFVKFQCNRIGFHDKNDFTIQLNHYVTKSYKQYFEYKIPKGDAEYASKKDLYSNVTYGYVFAQNYATVADYSAYRYMIQLKTKMDDSIKRYVNFDI